jgi:pimeloyl-ACP methyl ester carboxylesterase
VVRGGDPVDGGGGVTLAHQTRARYPDETGYATRDGVRTFWERYGDGGPTVLVLPPWSVIHSRCWKAQIPYLCRHFRVVAFDGRGNGRSDRPADRHAYAEDEYAADALAVLDETGTDRAVLVSLSMGAQRALILMSEHPERVAGAVFISPTSRLSPRAPEREVAAAAFEDERDDYEGWWKYNAAYWRRDYRGFLEFFFSQVFSEPHSTKQIEDCVGWGLDTDPETLIATEHGPGLTPERARALATGLSQPILVIHGDEDCILPHAAGAELARLSGGTLVTLAGSGHCPQARDPVAVNLLIRDFVHSLEAGNAT